MSKLLREPLLHFAILGGARHISHHTSESFGLALVMLYNHR